MSTIAVGTPQATLPIRNAVVDVERRLSPGIRTRGFAGLRHSAPAVDDLRLGVDGGEPDLFLAEIDALRSVNARSIRRLGWPGTPEETAMVVEGWRDDGTVLRDPESIYVVEYTTADTTVRGVLVDLFGCGHCGEWEGVLPHEEVDEDRVLSMRPHVDIGRVDVEPVLLVQEMTVAARQFLSRVPETRDPLTRLQDDELVATLWRVDDRDAAEFHAQLMMRPALLADGHHRFRAHDGVGHVLALVTDTLSATLRLGAIHRLVEGLCLDQLVAAFGDVEVTEMAGAASLEEAVGGVSPEEFVCTDGQRWVRVRPTPGAAADVVALHRILDPFVFALDVPWSYRHIAQGAVDHVLDVGGTAILLHAPSLDAVLAEVAAGRQLPAKATSFWPKPPLSMVIRDY